jgi:hypothetical protein
MNTAVANLVSTTFDATPFAKTETFESKNGVGPAPAKLALVSVITVFIMLLILLFVGKWLWNNVLVDLISIAKPVKSVWQLLGFAVLVSLLHPGCGCGVAM